MEETFTYDNYVQAPTSQQGFNRYAYCFYNPLRYVDPSGYLCDDPPYINELLDYACGRTDEKAKILNELGITHYQVYSNGDGTSHIRYDVGGEWYNYNYDGELDTGDHVVGGNDKPVINPCININGTVPMDGNTGIPVDGGNGGSGCGAAHDVANGVASDYCQTQKTEYYNFKKKTWKDKKGVTRSFDFNGNGSTGGRVKYAMNMSDKFAKSLRILKIADVVKFGYDLGKLFNGEISIYDMVVGVVVDGLYVVYLPAGLAATLGYDILGPILIETEAYQEFKAFILGEEKQIPLYEYMKDKDL